MCCMSTFWNMRNITLSSPTTTCIFPGIITQSPRLSSMKLLRGGPEKDPCCLDFPAFFCSSIIASRLFEKVLLLHSLCPYSRQSWPSARSTVSFLKQWYLSEVWPVRVQSHLWLLWLVLGMDTCSLSAQTLCLVAFDWFRDKPKT